ncbi:helix-hairpin-helix domain-containing protein [Catellatospora sichuanensis]|uniref:helix-hairpin-helix domain-containing protein n=1 Tax=Catellatospora sichuanensis TaxID=1969805 RepID=UPI0011833F16|nr:helix-hairpin-helix domain-containing protein [Catellatospora sichuanensis]
MAWFIGQSLLMILTAFLLGLLVGWLLFSRRGKSTPAEQPAAAAAPSAPVVAEAAAPVAAATVADEPEAAKPKAAKKPSKKAAPAPAAPADDEIEVQQRPVSLVAPIAKPEPVAETKPEPVPVAEATPEPVAAVTEPVAVADEPDDAVEAAVEAAQEKAFKVEASTLTPIENMLVAAGDNLQRIEGIGPRMEAALTAAGMGTYAAVAAADNDSLRKAIEAGGLNFAPALLSWSRQAQLLVDGDEEGLADLQRRLVAGRDTGRE